MFGAWFTFANPAVWYAASAVAVPIVLHLVLRTRTRRVVLPTLQFVKLSHQVSRARQKLRRLLLLAMRIAAILLIIALLAGTQVVHGGGRIVGAVPVALVVVIDNSASMSYKEGGRSHLAWGKTIARQIVEDLPAGSQVALVGGAVDANGLPKAQLTVDRSRVGRQIDEIPQTYRGGRLDSPLRQALGMLQEAPQQRRAVLLITDRTAAAWAGVNAADLAEAADAAVFVPDCWQSAPANVALGPARLSQAICPIGSNVQVSTTVAAVGLGGPTVVELRLEGRTIDQRGVNVMAGAAAAPVMFRLSPETPGIMDYSIHLTAADALEADNARYFSVTAEKLKTMLVVREDGGGDSGGTSTTAFVMANAVAPAAQTTGRLVQTRTISAARLVGEDLGDVALVMLAGIRRLPAGQWPRLEKYVTGGGRLWIVPNDGLDVADYASPAAKAVMPVEVRAVENVPQAVGVQLLTAPSLYLAPFKDAGNPPLSEIACRRRVLAGGGAGATVLAFADGAPAIAERRLGSGRVLWWGFSPSRTWSNLASDRLAQLPILARQAASTLLFDRPATLDCRCGETVRLKMPDGPLESAAVRDPAGVAQHGRVDPAASAAILEPDRPGRWRAELSGPAGKVSEQFTVNVDPSESDLRLLSYDQMSEFLGGRSVIAATDAQAIRRGGSGASRHIRLDWPLALAAALILIGESFLANRFYRQSGEEKKK